MNRRTLLGLVSVLCGSACLSRPPALGPETRASLVVRKAPLDAERIELHLVRPAVSGGRLPLVLYATGDGGWRSADRGLFEHVARWGYAAAGFSARRYLEHLRFEPTTPRQVARDYRELIAFARGALDLPGDTPTVLVGFSRGSGLAVVAAGQPEVQPLLAGVLAVALDDEEEYVRAHRSAGRDSRGAIVRELAALRPYEVLAGLGRLPVAVIQSTEDSYLPAARARELFGPDGERRRLYPIRARSHTFAGAREALYEQARVALEWILACGGATP